MTKYADNSKSLLAELIKITRYNLKAVGYESLTVAGSVVKLISIPENANYAIITVESDLTTPAIRYLELGDQTVPSSTVGIARSNSDAFDVQGKENLVNFRAIQVGAGTHSVKVQYYS